MAARTTKAGLEDAYLTDVRVHDLRHTVGMRLHETNVRESTVSDILWHQHRTMTGHCSVAQIEELVARCENGRSSRERLGH